MMALSVAGPCPPELAPEHGRPAAVGSGVIDAPAHKLLLSA